MKTPEEIKKGLECCWSESLDLKTCRGCPYDGMPYKPIDCEEKLGQDALAYIQQLESRLAQVERERDAAVRDLSNESCRFCKHVECKDADPCKTCRPAWYPACLDRQNFEWRGVCQENSKEE